MTDKELIVLDLKKALKGADEQATHWAYDMAKLVGALQGIVNRDEPRLFIYYLPNGLDREKNQKESPGQLDRFWLNWLRQDGRMLSDYTVIETANICEVLQRFAGLFKGLVVWDENVPSTANVASTFAGAMDALPVRGSTLMDSVFQEITDLLPDLPVLKDFRGVFTGQGTIAETKLKSTGSAKCDAYLWAVENILKKGLCSSTHFAYYLDGVPWNELAPNSKPYPDFGNAGILNADYYISHKAFFFDLSPWDDCSATDDPGQTPGTDYRTLIAILEQANKINNNKEMLICGGFVPWWLKYTSDGWCGRDASLTTHAPVASEWRFVDVLSAYNGMLDADAYGLSGLTNASVYRHYPLKQKYHQETKPKDVEYDPEKTYVLFSMLDYDSAAWLAQSYPVNWLDENRGKIPLWWGFNPVLSDRVPMVFDAMFESLTPNDTIGADEGLGYTNPNLLSGDRKFSSLPSFADQYLKIARPYFERFSMTTCAFVIVGDQMPVSEHCIELLTQLTPNGIGFQESRIEEGLYLNTPVKPEESDWFYAMKPEQCVESLERYIRQKGPGGFVFFRCILFSPTQLVEAVDLLREKCPDLNFEVSDPYTYFKFMKEKYSK